MPTAAPRDAVACVVGEARVCDGDSGAGSVGMDDSAASWWWHTDVCARRAGAGSGPLWRVASDDTSGCNTRAGGSGALAWASILGSYSLFRQMAHVSAAFASRAAPQRGVCRVRVRSAGAVGTRPRLAAGGGGGGGGGGARAAPVQMSQDQNVTAFLSRRATRTQTPSLRPSCCCHHKEPTQHGPWGAPHHFFTTKRGPSLLSFSTSISSSSAIPPRWKLPRCETPASGALRVGSRFSAPARALQEVCVRDGTRSRLTGLAVHGPSRGLAAHAASTRLRCVALVS